MVESWTDVGLRPWKPVRRLKGDGWRLSRQRSLALDQAALVGQHHSLNAIPHVKFREDVPDVRLDGCLADDEPIGDFGVRQA
jgi:hypothetical protein